MAGCKEPEPQRFFIGEYVIEDIPGQWKLVEQGKNGNPVTLQIDSDTQFVASFNDRHATIGGWIDEWKDPERTIDGQLKTIEILEKRNTENIAAVHVLLTMEDDYKYRFRDGYVFACGYGIGFISLSRTTESKYDVKEEEFVKILDSARESVTLNLN